MTNKSGNEPAFPTHVDFQATKVEDYMGLTKRDYFAACALQGFLSHGGHERLFKEGKSLESIEKTLAINAIDMANALISELEKESNA